MECKYLFVGIFFVYIREMQIAGWREKKYERFLVGSVSRRIEQLS